MPFKSKAQARAAFGGYLGPEMKRKARTWAHETPGGIKSLPRHKRPSALARKKMPRPKRGGYMSSNTEPEGGP